ncbi:MAG TPA: hypothetical protein VFA87_07140 [Rhizomicrobium sp.]|nr:hypothetical protein [Rhizomicrobium sp.]
MIRKKFLARLLIGALLAAGIGSAAIQPADARVFVRVGPPPVYFTPAPRPWMHGHWRWDGVRWVWAPPYWAAPAYRDTVWIPGHWAHRLGGWVWIGGHWV